MRPIEFFIAYRLLKEGRSQTLTIFAGAAVGVAVIVFITALISSLQANIIEGTLGFQPHVTLEPPEEQTRRVYEARDGEVVFARVEPRAQRNRSIDGWQRFVDDIAKDPSVTHVSPMAAGPGFAVRGNQRLSAQLMGVEPDLYQPIVDVEGRLIAGEFRVADNGVVLGKLLAEELRVGVGDRVRLVEPGGQGRSFLVQGLVDVGVDAPNETWALISLRNGQSLNDLPGGISRIEVTVDELFDADRVADRLQGQTDLDAASWQEENEQLLNALRSQDISTTLIRVFVSVAVALGIASVLIVTVVQKRGQIGVMRAMGASTGSVARIFLIQGAAVGLVGSLLGTGFGALLGRLFMQFVRDPDGEPLFPIEVSLGLVLSACAIATAAGLVAAVGPARRAAKLDPAEAITNA
jgi:lipoprotein-releasing system permease protein